MARLHVAGDDFTFDRAALIAYHCASTLAADWNLGLVRGDETLWLSGTITPAPLTEAALDGAIVRLDPHALDELVEALTGRAVVLEPVGADEVTFPLARTARGVRLAVRFSAAWEPSLGEFADHSPVEVALDIDADVAALHPHRLP
jgi:hypothetical protein